MFSGGLLVSLSLLFDLRTLAVNKAPCLFNSNTPTNMAKLDNLPGEIINTVAEFIPDREDRL